VEDLKYRLQDTDAKVELFLRTLSSMQDALSSSPAEAVPMEEPDVATGAATGAATRAATGVAMGAATGVAKGAATSVAMGAATGAARESKADDTEGDVESGKIWADQPTYVEEEPWPGDLQAKWPNYSPGV
jgi:hypothetical protein